MGMNVTNTDVARHYARNMSLLTAWLGRGRFVLQTWRSQQSGASRPSLHPGIGVLRCFCGVPLPTRPLIPPEPHRTLAGASLAVTIYLPPTTPAPPGRPN